jgi:glutamine synthetase
MVGSSQSTSGPNFVLNTAVADVLAEIADELEKAKDVNKKAQEILKKIAIEHKSIIFNGDNYSNDWVKEAKKRGLPNIGNAVDSLQTMIESDIISLYERHKVLSGEELHARCEILLERYCKQIRIEALTTISMAKRQILPAAIDYSGALASTTSTIIECGVCADAYKNELDVVCKLIASLQSNIKKLEKVVSTTDDIETIEKQAEAYRDKVIPVMNAVRADADELETVVDAEIWPLPTYVEMLFLR